MYNDANEFINIEHEENKDSDHLENGKINIENKKFIGHNENINLYQKQDNINTCILKNVTENKTQTIYG